MHLCQSWLVLNGAPLQYNHEYICNGERVAIARCYNEQDDAGCQVDYPDRPLRNGLMVQTVEDRGDVIRKLQACVAPRAASGSRPATQPPAAASPGRARAPGLGEASWRVLYLNPTSASFFTPATIRRVGERAIGWFTDIYARQQAVGDTIRGVSINQSLWEADCTRGTLHLAYVAYYRADGAPILENPTDSLAPQPQRPGTTGGLKLDVLCGRRVELFSNETMQMGVLGLRDVYATQLAFIRNGAAQGENPPSASPPPARPAAAGSPAAAPFPAPGMSVATWKFLTVVPDRAFLFVPSQVRRSAGGGQGWLMEAYRKPATMPDVRLRNVGIDQFLYSADCARNVLTNNARIFYTPTGAPLASIEGLGPVQPQPRSPAAAFMNVLCGRPQELWDKDAYTYSATDVRSYYLQLMQAQDAVDAK